MTKQATCYKNGNNNDTKISLWGDTNCGLRGASKNSLSVHHQYDKNVDHRTNNTTQFDEDKMNTYTNLYLLLVDSAVHCKLK